MPLVPRMLNCIVAVYMIVLGIPGLFGDIRPPGRKIDDA